MSVAVNELLQDYRALRDTQGGEHAMVEDCRDRAAGRVYALDYMYRKACGAALKAIEIAQGTMLIDELKRSGCEELFEKAVKLLEAARAESRRK